MTSEDVNSLRAEIKLWERAFQQENGKNPTVDDIRANNQIANKYRLYKKLSKAAPPIHPTDNRKSSSARSSTPLLKTERSSSVISNSRALETTSALSSYNPFSPQKDKGKQRVLLQALNAPTIPIPVNPFATPTKTKPKPRIREPSPSPIPESEPVPSVVQQSEPPSAVTRARKRLRGEPVSPSPNKDKRRRIISRTSISRRARSPSDSEEDNDEAGNSSFVADSPVKGSSSKLFMSLFEDASSDDKVKNALMRTKSTSASAGLFGPIRTQSVPFEDDLESVLGPTNRKREPRSRITTNGLSLSSKLAPRLGKDNLYSKRDITPQPSSIQTNEEHSANNRESGKRIHADTDSESEQPNANISNPASILIPPSPPREAPSQRSLNALSNKGKGKSSSRKKTKFDDDEDMDSLSDEVKVLPSISRPSLQPDDDDGLDAGPEFDPVFWYNHRVEHTKINNGERVNNTFEVDLPDKLKHVLALSSSDNKLRDIQEEKVAESLVYGRRINHYEPSKGGEIWDVGDVGSEGMQEETSEKTALVDEDWEGEPVPWEVGEL
ncbi:hypothetical protein GGU10DRAFT_23981 [Lentinula aff. detonsa]|uniref:DNA replication regulator SLD2 n=1 Tax=Lentinula aff. detonsa TaxID=2804958 RepID=A0AA38NIV4_9AGAR|nr:hypothetical protein GGU10DRAFT_23981 [Lentinula aff. detonsa]